MHTLNSYVLLFKPDIGGTHDNISFRREVLKNVGSSMAAEDGDIEFAKVCPFVRFYSNPLNLVSAFAKYLLA